MLFMVCFLAIVNKTRKIRKTIEYFIVKLGCKENRFPYCNINKKK